MYSKLMNNVRFCLGLCSVVALIGLIIGLVLYFKDDTAYAFIVTVGSGLLLFIVVIVATVIFRCLVTRPRLLHPQQRLSGEYPRVGKVLHDPPPPYKKAWAREFQQSQDTSDTPSSNPCILSKSVELIRHLEGSNTTRTSLDKLKQFEVQRQGVSVVFESPVDDELPAYDVAIRQLSARDLENAYREQLSVQMEESVRASNSSCFEDKQIPSTSQQVCPEMSLDKCYPQRNAVAERHLAPVHLPGKTVISIVACFENSVPKENDDVIISIEG